MLGDGVGTTEARTREDTRRADPCISGRVVAELRAHMLEIGVWPKVREALGGAPLELRWLDAAAGEPWVELETHLALLDAAGAALGIEAVRAMGRARMKRSARAGLFA